MAGLVPEHYYRTLCQNVRCRAALGGMHIPCVGGFVVMACHRCGLVSLFRNEQWGIDQYLLDRHGNQLDPKDPRRVLARAGAPPVLNRVVLPPSARQEG